MTIPSKNELADAIAEATRDAVNDLFSHHPEKFYYLSLITTGEGHAPIISAWSEEALERASLDLEKRSELKWSYADSPYCGYGEPYFKKVRELFSRRPRVTSCANEEWDVRLGAMEAALQKLDHEGFFGTGAQRNGLVLNAEVMPPDSTNTERAKRLNSPEAINAWLSEAAE